MDANKNLGCATIGDVWLIPIWSGISMKKTRTTPAMGREYDFATMKGGVRGKYAKSFRATGHSKASKFLYNRFIAGNAKREEEYEEAVVNAEVARKIFELRIKAGLTQQELAVRVGTSKSAICRLEDADYEGHLLSMVKRIAEALDKRVEIRFVSAKRLKTA